MGERKQEREREIKGEKGKRTGARERKGDRGIGKVR